MIKQDGTTQSGTTTLVALTGSWTVAAHGVQVDFGAHLPDSGGIGFDASRLEHWDSSLLIFLAVVRQTAMHRGIPFDDTGLPVAARRLLALIPAEEAVMSVPAPRAAWVARIGLTVIAGWAELLAVLELVGGSLLRSGAALGGGVRMRRVDLIACLQEAGIAALPIVAVVNLLVGGILAFVGAVQLRRFGADIYIANLVGIAVVREMAALMTAIVMSGRTGGAYAAQIATMQGTEEIDALRAIGIPVLDYLVLPRVFALTAMMPFLYLYASAIGVFGGFMVAIVLLNLSPESFATQAVAALSGGQILFGLTKSIAFGALIAIAGCRIGLKAGRSASDVGQAATTAVVTGIVGVIVLDAIFAVCANVLGF